MVLLAGSLFAADANPKDEVIAAIRRSSQTNYSWKATVESPNGGVRFNGPTDGKTEQGGYICLTMTRDDTTIEAVLKGSKGAVKTPENGWQSLAEFRRAASNRNKLLASQLENYLPIVGQAVDLAAARRNLKIWRYLCRWFDRIRCEIIAHLGVAHHPQQRGNRHQPQRHCEIVGKERPVAEIRTPCAGRREVQWQRPKR